MGSISRNFFLQGLASLLLLTPSIVLAQNDPSDWVSLHNDERDLYGIEPVSWDVEIAAVAQSYAQTLAADCSLTHSGNGYGENLLVSGTASETAAHAMEWWIKEKEDFDFGARKCHDINVCGHFSQVVWRASTAIGCGRADCQAGGDGAIFVCNYSPAGNVDGEVAY